LKFVLNREIGTTPLSQFQKYLVGVIARPIYSAWACTPLLWYYSFPHYHVCTYA